MIEIIAIDNQIAQADLLRLAAQFLESRLFTKKQQKQLHLVVEVTGVMAPRPIRREQLAKKPGLFKSAKFQYDCAVNVAQGFDVALAQFTHELIHVSQIIHNRYEIALKSVKKEGQKQKLYHAKWLGKKCGVIDDMIWESRPWESEAVLMSQQLGLEFFAFINGQQGHFPAQGKKKEFKLLDLQLALPPMPQVTAAPTMPAMTEAMAVPSAAQPMMPEQAMQPTAEAPVMQAAQQRAMGVQGEVTEGSMSDDELAALIASPEGTAFDGGASMSDMVEDDLELAAAISSNGEAGLPEQTAMPAFQPAPDMTDMAGHQPQAPLPDFGQAAMGGVDFQNMPAQTSAHEKQVYVQGINAPRMLSKTALEAKRQELAVKGLLK